MMHNMGYGGINCFCALKVKEGIIIFVQWWTWCDLIALPTDNISRSSVYLIPSIHLFPLL